MSGRKVLVVGSGGREHALGVALRAAPSVAEVVVTPGNAGTARSCRNVEGEPFEVARAERPDLIVIGPEAPLSEGLVDRLMAAGFSVFGPTRAAAALEASKAFMKAFADRHGLRTARHATVTSVAEAERAIREFDVAPVVKADGLCAGKGVIVARTHEEALEAAREMLSGQFGDSGHRLVIEERLEGDEASVHALCDGKRAFVLPAAQDHKRIFDGDRGPNTGGMGTYAPAPLVTPELGARVEREIILPTLRGMAAEGAPFCGTLFAGLMITRAGEPYLLEFNVRFGDPETQVLMNVLEGDLAELLGSAASGALATDAVRVAPAHAVCVVLAAAGYPGTPRRGDPITGIEEAEALEGVSVYHAGTRLEGGRLVTAGGRVLGVTARSASLREARELAYRAAELVQFEGKQMRRDIAARALGSP